jgi:DNA-binding HxlR family transcriptional regulator
VAADRPERPAGRGEAVQRAEAVDYVDRRLEEESPVATYYSLTEKGRSLCPVFEAIDDWAAEWLDV